MRNAKFLMLLVITGCVLFSGGCKVEKRPREPVKKEALKEEFFNFSLKELGGTKLVESGEFSGKPVFADFWATWCPPCRKAIPYVEKLHSRFGNKVHVIGINLDRNISAALKFVEKKSIGYTQLEGMGTGVAERYGVSGIPVFLITDANGKIVKKYVGFRPDYYDDWIKTLNELTR